MVSRILANGGNLETETYVSEGNSEPRCQGGDLYCLDGSRGEPCEDGVAVMLSSSGGTNGIAKPKN